MPSVTIRWTKGKNARDLLTIARPDGSSTWSRGQAFMAPHDLTHYVVETTLGLSNGFYGLLAQGWDISAFAQPGAPSRLPEESLWVESAVGLMLIHIMQGGLDVTECNRQLAEAMIADGRKYRRELSAPEFDLICARVNDLRAHWAALAPGESLELPFQPGVREHPERGEGISVPADDQRAATNH